MVLSMEDTEWAWHSKGLLRIYSKHTDTDTGEAKKGSNS